jgi:hypothetical protein
VATQEGDKERTYANRSENGQNETAMRISASMQSGMASATAKVVTKTREGRASTQGGGKRMKARREIEAILGERATALKLGFADACGYGPHVADQFELSELLDDL